MAGSFADSTQLRSRGVVRVVDASGSRDRLRGARRSATGSANEQEPNDAGEARGGSGRARPSGSRAAAPARGRPSSKRKADGVLLAQHRLEVGGGDAGPGESRRGEDVDEAVHHGPRARPARR